MPDSDADPHTPDDAECGQEGLPLEPPPLLSFSALIIALMLLAYAMTSNWGTGALIVGPAAFVIGAIEGGTALSMFSRSMPKAGLLMMAASATTIVAAYIDLNGASGC